MSMIDAEIFDQAMKDDGGRFHYENAEARVKDTYAEIAARAEDLIKIARQALPKLPRIHFGFVHNAEINATAFKVSDRYFIGLNTGTLFMLQLVIRRMMADPKVLPQIGDAAREDKHLPILADYSTDADEMVEATGIQTPDRHFSPRDASRRAYSEFLQDQAIMFLVGHEITHIAHGHVDYLSTKRGLSFTTELGWFGNRGGDEAIERQVLEMDADRRSIIARIDSLRLTVENPALVDPHWGSYREEGGKARIIHDWAVSMNIVFRMFGDVRFTRSDLDHSAYPPLPVRQLMCQATAIWTIERQWNANLSVPAKGAMATAHRETDAGFTAILGQRSDAYALTRGSFQTISEHGFRLQEYWNKKMVDRLKAFSFDP